MSTLLVLLAALGLWSGDPPAGSVASAPAGPAAEVSAPRWSPDAAAARRYAAGRAGTVSFSVHTRSREWSRGPRRKANSASVIKAMLMVSYLRGPEVRSRPLSGAERDLLSAMIRWSSNDAATSVRNTIGAEAILRLARRARMRDFELAPAWGLSQITAADQARFFVNLPELVPRRHRSYALQQLARVVPEQRWGVGRLSPRGWRLHFKGGWGSGTGAVSHQVALLRRGRQRVAVAVLTTSSPSHAYSQETLRGVFARLLRGLENAPRATEAPAAVAPAPVTPYELTLAARDALAPPGA